MSRDAQPRLLDLDVAGERVRLRPVQVEDAPLAYAMLHGRDEMLRWFAWKGPADREELRRAFAEWKRSAATGANYLLAIEDAESASFCGTLDLRFLDHPFVGEIGYWVAEEHQGRGIATEAVRLAARVAFDSLRSTALVADVFVPNHASARVLEKVGFERAEAPVLAPLEALDGAVIDRPKWSYALTRRRFRRVRPEWSPRRGRVSLEPRG